MSKIKLGVAIAILLFAGVIVVSQLYDIPLLTKKQLPQSFEVIWEKDFHSEVLGRSADIVGLPGGGVIFARTKPLSKGLSVPFIVRVDKDGNEIWRTTFEDKYTINDLSVLKLMPNNSIMLVCDKKVKNPDRVIPYIIIFGQDGKLLNKIEFDDSRTSESIVNCELIDDNNLYFVGFKYPFDKNFQKADKISYSWFGRLNLENGIQHEKLFKQYGDSYFCEILKHENSYILSGISSDKHKLKQNVICVVDMDGKIVWDFKSEKSNVGLGNSTCILENNTIATVVTKYLGKSLFSLSSEAICYYFNLNGKIIFKSDLPRYYFKKNKPTYLIVNSVIASGSESNAFFVVGLQVDFNDKKAMNYLYKLSNKSNIVAEFFYDAKPSYAFDDMDFDISGDCYIIARSVDLSKNNPAQTRLIKLRINQT